MVKQEMPINIKSFELSHFAERLKSRMEELSLNQSTLAQITNISQTTISKYLNQKQEPVVSIATALAQALSCDLSWLVGMEEGQEQARKPTPGEYVGPVSALEKAALTKALTVLRSTELRGSPAQALAVTIDAHYESVKYAAELGHNGGTRQQRAGESPASSARRKRAR